MSGFGGGGAKPDKIVVVTSTVQAALDSLPANGGTVYVPPGVYTESLRITKPNTRLTGTLASTIRTPPNATTLNNDACIRVVAPFCTVENLSLDGNKANNVAIDDFNLGRQADGVAIYADNCTVEGCKIFDTIGHQIIVWNEAYAPTGTLKGARSGFLIRGNFVFGVGQRAGIDIASTDISTGVNFDGAITGNIVKDRPIVIHTAHDVLIQGNVCHPTTQRGISVHTNSKRVLVTGNTVNNATVGMSTEITCEDVSFVGNKIFDSIGTGIEVNACTRSTIDGNQIRKSGGPGIAAYGGSDCRIRDNDIHEGVNTGVTLGGVALITRVQVSGNTISGCAATGIEVTNTDDLDVLYNRIVGGTVGINHLQAANTDHRILGNRVSGHSSIAVRDAAVNADLMNNDVTGGTDAFRLQAAGQRAFGNKMRANTGANFNLVGAPAGIELVNNRYTGTLSVGTPAVNTGNTVG